VFGHRFGESPRVQDWTFLNHGRPGDQRIDAIFSGAFLDYYNAVIDYER